MSGRDRLWHASLPSPTSLSRSTRPELRYLDAYGTGMGMARAGSVRGTAGGGETAFRAQGRHAACGIAHPCGAAAPGAPECKDQQERDIDDPRQGCVHWTRSHVSWTGSATAVREDSTSTERRAANSVGLGGVPPRARRAQPEQHVCRGVNFNGQYDMHRRIAPRQPPHRTSGVRRLSLQINPPPTRA